MQILSPGIDFSKVASSLSLVAANYKPVPVVQKSSSGSSSSGARVAQVQNGNSEQDSSWGLPSILHLPQTSSSTNTSGRQLASNNNQSGKSVGNSGCTIVDEYTPKGSLNVQFPSFNKTRANMMRYREQIGVNTGSWFVLENWMAGSLFKCAAGSKSAELDVLNGYGTSSNGIKSARALLEKHWDTFITEEDFKTMKSVGINTVRVPIGYWNAGGNHTKDSPFNDYTEVYTNTWKYLKRAIYWADKYDIGVLVDLHGAYGSQNSQAHSGVSTGGVQFYNKKNENLTKNFLLFLTREFANVTNVVGIELLNEPQNNDRLWPWYGKTMDAMRKVNSYAEDLPLYFHDAFSPSQGAKFVNGRSDFVVQDTHSYFVFTKQDQSTNVNKHTSQIKGPILNAMQSTSKTARGNIVVGEWSCALNPNSLNGVNNKHSSNAQYCQAQTDTYRNATAGALFWSWTMENCKENAGWCFKAALPGYMDGAYNAWGFSDKVSNKTIETVSSTISSTSLPSSYRSAKSQVSASTKNSAKVCSNSSSNSNSSASATSNATSGARNAQVVNSHSVSSKHGKSSKSKASGKGHHHHHSSSTSSHASHHPSHHSSSSSKSHSRRASKILGGGPAARAAHLVSRAAASETNAGNLGYADGFLTAQSFANQLTLSRVGFVEQYLSDTVSYYKKAKVVTSQTTSTYKKQFNKGLHKLEQDVVKKVQDLVNN